MNLFKKNSALALSAIFTLLAVPSLHADAAKSQQYECLTYMNYGGWIEITDCDRKAESVVIPEQIDGVTVRDIGDQAFSACSSLTQITIPDSVKNIGESAFFGCSSLTQISIPDSVEKLESSIFNGCSSLVDIDLPDNLTTIDSLAFAACGFTEFTIPDSVTTIGKMAFTRTSLSTITIPKNVQSIGSGAFDCGIYGAPTLTEIIVDPENTSFIVKDNALLSADLTELISYPAAKEDTVYTMPESVTTIYSHAFDCAKYLEQITLSDQITILPESAVSTCRNLKEIIIPDGVTTIDKTAFYGCSNLTSVYLPKSIESISFSAFLSCPLLTDVYYAGSEEDWNAVDNDSGEIANANIHYNYNGNTETTETLKGDVNADGTFSVLDVVQFQKWLLNIPDTHLNHWKAADFTDDGVLNVFDLILMKKSLLDQPSEPEQTEPVPTILSIYENHAWGDMQAVQVYDQYGKAYEVTQSYDGSGFYQLSSDTWYTELCDTIRTIEPDAYSSLPSEAMSDVAQYIQNIDQHQDCQMSEYKQVMYDYGREDLYVIYQDKDGNPCYQMLCEYGDFYAWQECEDVQHILRQIYPHFEEFMNQSE